MKTVLKIMVSILLLSMLLFTFSPISDEDTDLKYKEVSLNPNSTEKHGTRGGNSGPSMSPLYNVELFLNTSGGNNELTTVETDAPQSAGSIDREYSSGPLGGDLYVEPGNSEFVLKMTITAPALNPSEVTLEVLDNTEVIARYHDDSYSGSDPDWEIPMLDPPSHTFLEGHELILHIQTTSGGVQFESDGRQARLIVRSHSVSNIEHETYNSEDDKEETFFPYDWPYQGDDDRTRVIIKGNFEAVYGTLDLWDLRVTLRDPSGDTIVNNETTSWERGSGHTPPPDEFTYTWDYLGDDVSDGIYTYITFIEDIQGNEYYIDGNFTMAEHGLKLTAEEEEYGEGSGTKYQTTAVKNVIQNDSAVYEIHVRNIGFETITVKLEILDAANWNAQEFENRGDLEERSADKQEGKVKDIPEGANSFETVYFNVSAEEGKDLDDTALLDIKAQIEDKTPTYRFNTINTVVMRYDVELKFSDGSTFMKKTIDIGGTATYSLAVKNKGGETDTFTFTYPTLGSWGAELTDNNGNPLSGDKISLASDETADLILKVIGPTAGSDETVNITVRATSDKALTYDITRYSEVKAQTTMTTGIRLEISGSDSSDVTPPDEQISFAFELTNTGANATDYTITFVSPDTGGWKSGEISLSSSSTTTSKTLTIAGGEDEIFYLYVQPSLDVTAGDYDDITVKAERSNKPNIFEEEEVECIVNEVYDTVVLQPTVFELEGEVGRSEDVQYNLKIKNNGNTPEKVDIDVLNAPGGWDYSFNTGQASWNETLDPGDEEDIVVTLTAADDAPIGDTVDITIRVSPKESDNVQILTHNEVTGEIYERVSPLIFIPLTFLIFMVLLVVMIRRRG